MTVTSNAVAALFPLPVAAAVVPVSGTHRAWSDDEAAAIAHAVPSRRQEFLSGRAAARVALVGAGFEPAAVPRGERGAPAWPSPAIGSISHAGGWCVAVVVARAEGDAVRGIGVDVHVAGALDDPNVLERVLTPPEVERGSADVVFAAKEAVFKAVNPATGRWLEHHDVEIDIDRGTFEVRRPVDLRAHLSGRWRVIDSLVLAGCVLR